MTVRSQAVPPWCHWQRLVRETTTQADQITALRVVLGAGPHADAPSPDELKPRRLGMLPALVAMAARAPEPELDADYGVSLVERPAR